MKIMQGKIKKEHTKITVIRPNQYDEFTLLLYSFQMKMSFTSLFL